MELLNFINIHFKEEKEIIFFGGSFNPWHDGHSMCLELMDKNKNIIVLPDHNPQKKLTLNIEKESQLDDIERKIRKHHSNAFLFKDFWNKNKKNPTAHWVQELKEKSNFKISLLMGFDTFASLHSWIQAEGLIRNLSQVYIASRLDDEELKKEQINRVQLINPKLLIKFLGNHEHEHLSSTNLR